MRRRVAQRSLVLLASSSLAALMIGAGAPPAFAGTCAITVTSGTVASESISSNINCINIQNATVTGNVINTGTGVIAATQTGIIIKNSSIGGTISNSGTITAGTAGIDVNDVSTFAGGISNSGTISSGIGGILVGGSILSVGSSAFSGGITNSGMISAGSGPGISSEKVSTFAGGIINSGTISSQHSGIFVVRNSTFSGGIVNTGTIGAGATGIFVGATSTLSGGITNSGMISASRAGINLNTVGAFAGGIANTGTIAAGITAGIIVNGVSAFAGGITNSGTISSASNNAIAVYGVSTFGGGIGNGGTIAAQNTGIGVYAVTTFAGGISNSGTIAAQYAGIGVYAVTTFAGGISNSGTISSNGAGIRFNTVSQFSGGIANAGSIAAAMTGIQISSVSTFAGGITNSSAGTISGGYGITVTLATQFGGGIANAGTIRASSGIGIFVEAVSDFAGGITNNGVISALNTGIAATGLTTFGGGITNSGTITGGRVGIAATAASQFNGGIGNAGNITAAGDGIEVSVSTFADGITNSSGGTISAANGIAVVNITQLGNTETLSSFSGGIINNGLISAANVGITVTGVTTFAGGIANAGTIRASSGIGISVANVLALSGGIINSGMISVANTGIAVARVTTFAGGISNSGTISTRSSAKAGIAVNNVSQFSGGIGNAGTITAAAGAGIKVTLSTFAGGITNSRGGTISGFTGVDVANVRQFGGGITNSGTVTANKTGIFLGTIASFSGNVSNAGTIAAATAIRFSNGITFAAGSALVNSGTITGSTMAIDLHAATSPVTIDQTGGTINGAIRLSSNADVFNISGGAINGNIIGAGSSDTINFAPGAGNSVTYANSFTAINQVNIDSGTVVLNGSNVATHVDVDGGTLAGTGIIDPLTVTIHSGATLQPGAPGTAGGKLSIVGSLAFQSAAVYLVTINGANASYTSVTGTATLGGAQVSIASGSTVVMDKRYTILTDAGGGLGGGNTFAGTVGYDRLRGTLSYDANDVYATFQWVPLGSLLPPDAPVNITNTAAAIDHFTGGGNLPAGFQNLYNLSPVQLENALAQLSGEVATGAERDAFLMTTEFLNVMLDPFVIGRGGNNAGGPALGFAPEERGRLPDDVATAYESVLGKAPPESFQQRWSAWGSAYGGSNTNKGDPVVGSNNISASTLGFAGGIDYHFTPSTLAGFALAGGGTNWGLANALGSGRSDALQVGGYGISWFGPVYVAGALSFSNHWFTTNRSVLGDQLTANFIGQSYGARFEGGYRYGVLPTLGVTPYGAVQVQNYQTPAYSENDLTGGGFGLAYAATNSADVRTELGARFDAPTLLCDNPLMLYGRVVWAHDFVSNPALSASFETLSGSSFTVYGAPIPHDTALTTVGAQLLLSANWSVTGTFNGDFAQGSQTYSGNGKLRYTW